MRTELVHQAFPPCPPSTPLAPGLWVMPLLPSNLFGFESRGSPFPTWSQPRLGSGLLLKGASDPVSPPIFLYIYIYIFFNFWVYFIYFIYLFTAVLGLRFCARSFSSCGKRGPLFIAVRRPLIIAASLVAEHRLQTRRLSNCGSRAYLLRGMWDPPRPGLETVSPALAGRFSTTVPPGKPPPPIYGSSH